jgi:hypothetical protein
MTQGVPLQTGTPLTSKDDRGPAYKALARSLARIAIQEMDKLQNQGLDAGHADGQKPMMILMTPNSALRTITSCNRC